MKKRQCLVIGLGRFGSSIAETLTSLGHDVLAIDEHEDNVRKIHDKVSHAVQADVKDETVIESLGIKDFDVAVVAIGEDVESSCMAIIALKKQGIKNIIAKAKSLTSGTILKAVGADKVIYPEKDMGKRVARNLFSTDIVDFFELSDEYSIVEIEAPKWCHNIQISELNIRENFKLNVVAIKNGSYINAEIFPNTIVKEHDILVLVGNNKNIMNFN